MVFNKKRADDAHLSLDKSVRVCGVEIKKMPFGAYVNAMALINEAPFEFFYLAFGERSLEEALEEIRLLKPETLKLLLGAIFQIGPEYIIKILSKLTGIEESRLLEDENIGLTGIVEIIQAFIEVNGLGKFRSILEMKVNQYRINGFRK